ncbi:MAG: hypothetical protein LBH59_06740 [Planctomycetaceae bacterium]|nr:hypothetical protein [Planctomycetaceae bacterium]
MERLFKGEAYRPYRLGIVYLSLTVPFYGDGWDKLILFYFRNCLSGKLSGMVWFCFFMVSE